MGLRAGHVDDIERFAEEHGYKVKVLSFEEPEDPSPLVADLHRAWYRRRRIPANRLIVWSFIAHEPYWTLRTGSVPYWMKFNMEPSLAALERYLDRADPFDEIHLSLFQHGVEAVGLPRKEEWEALLERATRRGTTLGVNLDEYPLDFPHYARYDEAVRDHIPARYPVPAPLSLDDVAAFLDEHGQRYAVELEDRTPAWV